MGFKNLSTFTQKLDHFAEVEVPKEYVRRQIEITIFLLQRLQEYTPQPRPGESRSLRKSTGHAVANWRVTMNEKKRGVIGSRENPRPKLSSESVRASLTKPSGGARIFTRLLVYNNVHYMKYLDKGWSSQAPAGIVDLALHVTRDYIARRGWGAKK